MVEKVKAQKAIVIQDLYLKHGNAAIPFNVPRKTLLIKKLENGEKTLFTSKIDTNWDAGDIISIVSYAQVSINKYPSTDSYVFGYSNSYHFKDTSLNNYTCSNYQFARAGSKSKQFSSVLFSETLAVVDKVNVNFQFLSKNLDFDMTLFYSNIGAYSIESGVYPDYVRVKQEFTYFGKLGQEIVKL